MLTGGTPFEGWTMAQLRQAHLSGRVPPLRLRDDDPLSERLEALLLKCLAWQSTDRLQTVRELHEALAALHDPSAWTTSDTEAFLERGGEGAIQLAHSAEGNVAPVKRRDFGDLRRHSKGSSLG